MSDSAFNEAHEDALEQARLVFEEMPDNVPAIFKEENEPIFQEKIDHAHSNYQAMNEKNEVNFKYFPLQWQQRKF